MDERKPVDVAEVRALPVEYTYRTVLGSGCVEKADVVAVPPSLLAALCDEVERLRACVEAADAVASQVEHDMFADAEVRDYRAARSRLSAPVKA